MAEFKPDISLFAGLKEQVVVLTGGSTGIGAATVRILAEHGAFVIFGDVNKPAAEELTKQYASVQFVYCDVSQYDDIYRLFKTAHERYGHVNHAISCAGIFEKGNWFDPDLTIDSVKNDKGNLSTLNVNVEGTLKFSRIAAVYLRDSIQEGENKSLTLLSSVNAFRESPGLFIYQPGKHAILGLLRSSRKILFERDGIRVNAVCPGMTDTPMASAVVSTFRDNGLWVQTPESVAHIIVGIGATQSVHGKAYYIEGGDAWEFEDNFYAMQPQWLGEEPTRRLRMNADAINKGALAPKE